MSESKEQSTERPLTPKSGKPETGRSKRAGRIGFTLLGAASGILSIGDASPTAQNLDLNPQTTSVVSDSQLFHPSRLTIAENFSWPTHQSKDSRIQISDQEQKENKTQEATEVVSIPPRIIEITQLDQLISSLDTSQIALEHQLGQLTNEYSQAKEEFKNSDPQAIKEFEDAKNQELISLNQQVIALKETKAQIENQQQEFKKRSDEDTKALKDQSDNAQREIVKARDPEKAERDRMQKTAADVSDDLTKRVKSDKERALWDRANQEVEQARILLEQSAPQDRESFQKNLYLAEEQKSYIDRYIQSLNIDVKFINDALSNDHLLWPSGLLNLRDRVYNRPDLSVKFWELEAERAQLGLDPNRTEATPQGNEYLEWIQNELKAALAEKEEYQNPQTFEQTAEGQLLSVNKDQINAWLKYQALDELLVKNYRNVDKQQAIFQKMLRDIHNESKTVQKFFDEKGQQLPWSQGQSLAKTFKVGTLKRAISLDQLWTQEIERLKIFGELKSSELERASQSQAQLAQDLAQLIIGNEEDFTANKNSDQGLEQLVTKIDDTRFSQTPEAIFLNAHQKRLRKNPIPQTDTLEEQVTTTELNSRSTKIEAGELKEFREYFLTLPEETQQRFKKVFIEGGGSRWASLNQDEIQLNVFGDVPAERQARLVRALDQLQARIENKPQNNWGRERIASIKQLYPLTEVGRAWVESVPIEQVVGRPTERYAVSMSGRSIFAPGAQINGMISELGHTYFGIHPFGVRNNPNLSWDDGDPNEILNFRKEANRSPMPSAYREWMNRLDAFTAQSDAGDAEPLRRWINQSWPHPTDGYHHAQMNIPWAMGGGITFLKDTPFADYFDQFLAEGDFKSWGELASWYSGLSKDEQEVVQAYTDDHDNLFPIMEQLAKEHPSFLKPLSEQRKKELDLISSRKKAAVEKEWQQELIDFGDQFPLYIDLIDYPTNEWLKYQGRILKLHQKYPSLLNQSHPTAYNFLQKAAKKTA